MEQKLEALQAELDELDDKMDEGRFVPLTASGQQLTPGHLRAAIRKHLSSTGSTQSKFLLEIRINSNSFGKFMKGAYKDPWSACENGTYWAAAKYLARKKILDKMDELKEKAAAKEAKKTSKKAVKVEEDEPVAKETKKTTKKRSLDTDDDDDEEYSPNKKVAVKMNKTSTKGPVEEAGQSSKKRSLEDDEVTPEKTVKKAKSSGDADMNAIAAVPLPDPCPVYANCDEVRRMINHYLNTPGVKKTHWLNIINTNSKSLTNFMKYKGKGAGANNGTYVAAWRFFEQKRLLEKKPKSAKRLEQEKRWGTQGFPLQHDDGKRRFFPGQYDARVFDIEWCQDKRRGVV